MQLSTHNGTHLDAPWHFASTMDGGKRAITIDEVPLDWCFQPGVKLDFRHFADGYVATAADVEAELERIGHTLSPLEIVVVNTAPARATATPTTSPPAAAWAAKRRSICIERGVRLTGTDAWSWDAPFVHTAKKYARDPRRLADLGRPQGRPRHRLLPHREAAQPREHAADGFMIACFPVKIKRRLRRLDARRRDH